MEEDERVTAELTRREKEKQKEKAGQGKAAAKQGSGKGKVPPGAAGGGERPLSRRPDRWVGLLCVRMCVQC